MDGDFLVFSTLIVVLLPIYSLPLGYTLLKKLNFIISGIIYFIIGIIIIIIIAIGKSMKQ